jgi:hypothetical protein
MILFNTAHLLLIFEDENYQVSVPNYSYVVKTICKIYWGIEAKGSIFKFPKSALAGAWRLSDAYKNRSFLENLRLLSTRVYGWRQNQ